MIVTSNSKDNSEVSSSVKFESLQKSDKSDIFANLLNSVSSKDEKSLPKGLLLLNLVDDEKGIDLSALNKKSDKEEEVSRDLLLLLRSDEIDVSDEKRELSQDIKFFNQKIVKNLDEGEVKVLIKEAKAYLKEQINKLEPHKETPNSLRALVKMSEEMGIKLENISLKELVHKNGSKLGGSSEIKALLNTVVQSPKEEVSVKDNTSVSLFSKTAKEHTTAQIVQIKSKDSALEDKKETKISALESLLNPKNKEKPTSLLGSSRNDVFKEVMRNISSETKGVNLTQNAASTVSSESTSKSSNSSALSELLGNSDKSATLATTIKLDALEPKIVEAKQLTRHFSSGLKEAVEDYKPPFTKLEMKLNPAKFGEVDLTIVQRGNSVHILVNSNTQAITTMMQNVQDLKNQLAQNGMGNATLNFSSGDSQQQQSQDHQQNSQQQRREELLEQYEKAENSLEYETASALEIVLPRYI